MTSLEQERARFARDRVPRDAVGAKDYKQAAERLPGMIAVNGLLAVLLHEAAAAPVIDLSMWLAQRFFREALSPAEFRDRLVGTNNATYIRHQEEALLMAKWLKLWAQACAEANTAPPAEAEVGQGAQASEAELISNPEATVQTSTEAPE